jgi:inosine/xanthosine triphosphatase
MRIHVGTRNPLKVRAARAGFVMAFPGVPLQVIGVPVDAGVPAQPFDEQVAVGAVARARRALDGADYGVGVEAGLVRFPGCEIPLSVQFCAIVDRYHRITLGHGPGYALPPFVLARLRGGSTLNREMSTRSGIEEVKETIGAVGVLSGGRIDRFAITREAVLMALLPRFDDSSKDGPVTESGTLSV